MTKHKVGLSIHYRRYVTGSVMATMAGLVSFPIMTRLLDNAEYGVFGYYATWVLMAIAVGKLGAQHAIQRFYPHGGDAAKLAAFSTNLYYLPLTMSFTLWACIAMALIAFDWGTGQHQSPVFWIILVSSPMYVFTSLTETVMRVTEDSRQVMLSRVVWRWLELVFMLSAVYFFAHTALAAYVGKLLVTLLVVGFYITWVRPRLTFSRTSINLPQLREGLIYGMPLVLNEMIAVALVMLDRLMIKGISGDFAQVGIYSIGSALAMQVNVFTNLTVFEAFTPMANRLFATEGPAAVRALKAQLLLPMTYGAVLVASGLWCFGGDLLVALSGHAKAASGPVFALLGIVYCLQPLLLVAGYGLLLERRSSKVMALMFVSLVVNAVLNALWIPRLGVMGAVYATMASSAVLAIAHCLFVPRELRQLPRGRTVATAALAATVCIGGVTISHLGGLAAGWPRLIVGSGLLASAYVVIVMALDGQLRQLALSTFRQWFVRARAA